MKYFDEAYIVQYCTEMGFSRVEYFARLGLATIACGAWALFLGWFILGALGVIN